MQKDEQCFIVLDVNGYINALKHAVNVFNQTGLELKVVQGTEEVTVHLDPLPTLCTTRALRVLYALVEETVSQHVHYRLHSNPVPVIAQTLRDCAVPSDEDCMMTENFLCNETVDGVVLELTRQVSHHISGQPWRQWQVMSSSHMLALIGGKDFRVAEWERFHGHDYRSEDELLRVNITSTVNIIQYSIGYDLAIPIDNIPIHALVLDTLRSHCPEFVFKNDHTLYPSMLDGMGVSDYEAFYRKHLREPIESFVLMFLHSQLEPFENYDAELTDDFLLVVTRRSKTRSQEERLYRELRQSIDAGDWLPEREIRWMRQYERTR